MEIKHARCITAGLLCIIMLLTASCGSKQEGPSSIVDIYRNTAQALIDSGDYESAIQALEEGIAATGDESLATLLEEAKTAQEAQNEDGTGQDNEQPPEADNEDTVSDGSDGEPDVSTDGNNESTADGTDLSGDNIQPSGGTPEPSGGTETSDSTESMGGTEPTDNGQTEPLGEGNEPLGGTTEPTEPESPPVEPDQVVGIFDDFVGTWQDENGYGIYLCVGYGDDTKQQAYAALYSAVEFEVELELGESNAEESSAFGAFFPQGWSAPEYTLELYRYKWWMDAYIYHSDGSDETIRFYPADMSLSPPENPYYVG